MRLLIILACLIVLAASQAFIQPYGITRTFYPGGPYQTSVCVEDGTWADHPVTDSPNYDFQTCRIGQIYLSQYQGNWTLAAGLIGSVAASIFDLGTTQEIAADYDLLNYRSSLVFASISYNSSYPNVFSLLLSDPDGGPDTETFQPFEDNVQDWLSKTTSGWNSIPLTLGHNYLIRLTETETTTSFTHSIAAIKLVPLELAEYHATLFWVNMQIDSN